MKKDFEEKNSKAMKKHSKIAFSFSEAQDYINVLSKFLNSEYGIRVIQKQHIQSGLGAAHCGVNGDFHIDVGLHMRTNTRLFSEHVEVNDFLDTVRALFHETQHVKQHCKLFQNTTPSEDDIVMCMRQLAGERNKEYHKKLNRYNNDLSEIDAELTALTETYNYIKINFKKENPERLICNLVNTKTANADYFIQGKYRSFNDITEAFLKRYDDIEHAQIAGYIAWVLRPSQDYNPEHDECIRYLQSCVRENPEEMKLLTQFNSVSDPHQKDLMIASIVCHLHPEIEYERVYPCLSDIDLSPDNIFDRELPQPPEGFIKPIPKEDIERRIELAKFIRDKIVESEMRQYSDESKSREEEVLNESLVSERESEKTDVYRFM